MQTISFLVLTIFIYTTTSTPASSTLPHCTKQSTTSSQCLQCEPHYVLNNNKECVACHDENCRYCQNPNQSTCIECDAGFTLSYKKCGVSQCDGLSKCKFCSPKKDKCFSCKYGCEIVDNKCNCTSRVVIIVVCTLIALIVVIVVIVCVNKTAFVRKSKVVNFVLEATDVGKGIVSGDSNNKYHKDDEQDITRDDNTNTNTKHVKEYMMKTLQNKIEFKTQNSNEELQSKGSLTNITESKMICDYCLVENGNVKLSCGCFLCIVDRKLITNSRSCPCCKKEIEGMYQINCGICGKVMNDGITTTTNNNNNNNSRTLHCECNVSVCELCYERYTLSEACCSVCMRYIS